MDPVTLPSMHGQDSVKVKKKKAMDLLCENLDEVKQFPGGNFCSEGKHPIICFLVQLQSANGAFGGPDHWTSYSIKY